MNPQPKPKPRAPKARKPIARKRATPRRVKHECTTRGCKRAPTAGVMCLTHAKAKADELWSASVRTGQCELSEWHSRFQACGGPIQGCHGVSRGHMGTRYLLENGFSGCSGINKWAKDHGAEWDRALRLQLWGEEKYNRLWALADNFKRDQGFTDYAEIIARLTGQSQSKEEARG
jgi:hypothetical protein